MSEARRIVLVLHDFGAGGTERVAVRLANAWAEAGRDVAIVCGDERGPARSLVRDPVEVAPLDPPIRRGPASRLRLGLAVRRALKRQPADLVFIPGNFHLPLTPFCRLGNDGPAIAARLSNPLIRADRGRVRSAGFAWLFRRYALAADLIVATSDGLAAQARTLAPRAAVAVLPLPLIEEGTGPAAAREPHDGLDLVAIGRLVPQKRFELALDTLAALRRQRPVRLTIVGDGPDAARLATHAGLLGIADRVTFAGHAADVRPALAAADLLLVTSRYEAGPAVVIEALAAGRRVVATDCSPALPDMLADRRLGRITTADPDALCDAILTVSDEPVPPTELFAEAVRPNAIHKVAAAYLDLFDAIAARRR